MSTFRTMHSTSLHQQQEEDSPTLKKKAPVVVSIYRKNKTSIVTYLYVIAAFTLLFTIYTKELYLASEMEEGGTNATMLFLPLITLTIYLGLISGYISSPLYYQNDKWPQEYVIFQLLLIIFTTLRLSRYPEKQSRAEYEEVDDNDDYTYKNDFEELTTFTYWMGEDLHHVLYKGDKGIEDLIKNVWFMLKWWFGSMILSYVMKSISTLRKIDEMKIVPTSIIVLRNFIIFAAITVYGISYDLFYEEEEEEGGRRCSTFELRKLLQYNPWYDRA